MIEAEPERRGRRELGVATADDAAGEQAKRRDEYDAAGGQMGKDIRRAHAADHRQRDEAADEDQRHPVGDGQGQEIARGSECHHRWKQRQPDRIGDHDHVVARLLERVLDEGRTELRAQSLHDGDDRDRDAGGDEAIFDGGRARLVLHEALHEIDHFCLHGSQLTLLAALAVIARPICNRDER